MEFLPYILLSIVGLIAGVLSGIGGGGAGMIMIPTLIALGLPPQVAVATGKMNGLGSALGGLSVFAKSAQVRKDILKVMIPVAIVVGIMTPFIFTRIDSDTFQVILGIVLILLVPTLFLKKKITNSRSKKSRTVGYVAYSGVITMQSLFGAGVGSLALFVLTLIFGTTKLEANATRKAVSAVLTPITFAALFIGGFVWLSYGIVGMVSMFIGSRIGAKIAIKNGDKLVAIIMAVTTTIACVLLIYTSTR